MCEHDVFVCEVWEVNKAKRSPVPKDGLTRVKETLDYVRCDNLSPVSPVLVVGHEYAIGFQNRYSCYGRVYFLKNRDGVAAKFEQFCVDIGRQNVMVTDCASEVGGGEVKTFCGSKNIRQESIICTIYTREER